MELKRLRITNCSWIADTDIEVRDNMVIIGPNGSGKTTVLLCLDMLLGMDDPRLRSVLSAEFVRDKALPMAVEAVFGNLRSDERALFPDETALARENELAVKLEARAIGDDVDVVRGLSDCGAQKALSDVQRNAFGWTFLQVKEGLLGHISLSAFDSLREGTNLLAIDEPEAHLHPSSQRSMAKMLKASGGQKILVTHSPTIAGLFEPDEIVVIRADGCAVQSERRFLSGDSGMLARWWIGRQLEPLTAGAVIAVEGPSDRIIVDRVATALGFDLDQHDVVLVETNGCGDMKVVEAIFGSAGFGIPLFELIDEDASDDAAKRLGVEPADLEGRSVFVSARDLEDEYVRAIGARALWDRMTAAGTFSKNVFRLCEVGSDGYPTEKSLAQFIREKSNRKIPSALVAAGLIDATVARKVESVSRLLQAVSS